MKWSALLLGLSFLLPTPALATTTFAGDEALIIAEPPSANAYLFGTEIRVATSVPPRAACLSKKKWAEISFSRAGP